MTQKTRKITGKQFQPLIQEGAAQDTAREKAFSCTPSQKGLRLKLSSKSVLDDEYLISPHLFLHIHIKRLGEF